MIFYIIFFLQVIENLKKKNYIKIIFSHDLERKFWNLCLYLSENKNEDKKT